MGRPRRERPAFPLLTTEPRAVQPFDKATIEFTLRTHVSTPWQALNTDLASVVQRRTA